MNISRNIEYLAQNIRDLKWSEMVQISQHIAEEIDHKIQNDEPIDRDSMSQMLSDMAEDIAKAAEEQKKAKEG